MRGANARLATTWAATMLPSLCLLVPLGAPFEALAETSAAATDRPQEPWEITEAIAGRYIIVGRLVSIEGRIEFTDHPLGRQGSAKDEAYVIQNESGDRVRVGLRNDTLVELQVALGDRVLAFLDEHGKATSIWEVP